MKSQPDHEGQLRTSANRRGAAAIRLKADTGDGLRDTGIGLIGNIPWGTHICLFCDKKKDLLDAVCAYFAPARRAQEQCIWVVSDPLSVGEAAEALQAAFPDFESRREAGRFEIHAAADWYFHDGRFDRRRVVSTWQRRIDEAIANGLDGVRACSNPLWRSVDIWNDIVEYEHALDATLAGRRIIKLCAYMTANSRPEDVLDVAHTHQCVIARRSGSWQFLEVPGANRARGDIRPAYVDIPSFPGTTGKETLTDRERVILAQLLRGASSKKTARILGISHRTVDFHRANMMRKLGARNSAELIAKVLAMTKSAASQKKTG